METGASIGTGITNISTSVSRQSAEVVGSSIGASAGGMGKSISSPEAPFRGSISSLDSFHAFDPSVFERAPSEWGPSIDVFKDTTAVATAKQTQAQTASELAYDFGDFELFTPATPVNEGPVSMEQLKGMQSVWEAPKAPKASETQAETTPPEAVQYDFESEFERVFEQAQSEVDQPQEVEQIQAQTESVSEATQPITQSEIETQDRISAVMEELQSFVQKPAEGEAIEAETTDEAEPEDQAQGRIELADSEAEVEPEADQEEIGDGEETKVQEKRSSQSDAPNYSDESEDETEDEEPEEPEEQDARLAFVVDETANAARILDAEEALVNIEPDEEGKIHGSEIADAMGEVPSAEEISAILGTSIADDSYTELVEEIAPEEFDDTQSAITSIRSAVEKIPAVAIAQSGKTASKQDVERVIETNQAIEPTLIHDFGSA